MTLKILHINCNKEWRGGEYVVHEIFNGQFNQCEQYLFCPANSELANRNTPNTHLFTYKKRMGVDVAGALQLKKIIHTKQIQLVHLHDAQAQNLFYLACIFGVKVSAVIHRHVNYPIKSAWKYTNNRILKIICVSKSVENTVHKYTLHKQKTIVIYSGIDIKKYSANSAPIDLKKELGIPKKDYLIGIVSALEIEKNVEEFCKIAQLINKEKNDYHFVVIGKGSFLHTYQQQYPFIHFVGFKENSTELLQQLDVFLFTSKSEGLGMALIEAMAAHIPVVGHTSTVIKEIIEHSKNGFIYTTKEEAIKNIYTLIEQPDLKNKIIQNASKSIAKFEVSLMNKQLEALYISLLIK
ncbi:MAG: glycosyltransferase family 4 protein [Chitinophagales bacterium]